MPRRPAARRRSGASSSRGATAAATGSTTLLGPRPSRCRSTSRCSSPSTAGRYRRERVVFDTEATMSVPAYLLVRTTGAEPGPGGARRSTGTARASPRCAGSTTRRAGGDAEARRLRATSSRAAATSCSRPTCAASASGPTGTRRTTTHCDPNLVHAVDGRASSRSRRTCGTCSARSTCSARTRSSTRRGSALVGLSYGGTMTLFLAAVDDRVRGRGRQRATSRRGRRRTGCRGTCAARRCCRACSARSSTSTSARWSRPGRCWSRPAPRTCSSRSTPRGATVARLATRLRRARRARRRLVHDVFEGEHRWHGVRAYAFLDRWL